MNTKTILAVVITGGVLYGLSRYLGITSFSQLTFQSIKDRVKSKFK